MIAQRILVTLFLAALGVSASGNAPTRADEIALQARAHAASSHQHFSHNKRIARVPRSSILARDQAAQQASLDCWQAAFEGMNKKWQQAVAGGHVVDFDSFAKANGGLPDPNNCNANANTGAKAPQPKKTQPTKPAPQAQQAHAQSKPKPQQQQPKPQQQQPKPQHNNGGSNSNNNNNNNNGGGSAPSSSGVCGSVNAKPIDALLSQSSSQLQAIGSTLKAAAAAEGVPAQLLVAIAYAESTGGQDGAAYANGGGMFQFTDAGAWAQYGDGKSRMDNGASAWASARYMHDLCQQNGGSLYNALRAYNGPLNQGGNPDYQNEIYAFMQGQNFS